MRDDDVMQIHPLLSYRTKLVLAPRDLLLDGSLSATARLVGIWVRDYEGYLTAEVGATELNIPVAAFLSALSELLYTGQLPEGVEELLPDPEDTGAEVHAVVSGAMAARTTRLTLAGADAR